MVRGSEAMTGLHLLCSIKVRQGGEDDCCILSYDESACVSAGARGTITASAHRPPGRWSKLYAYE